MGVRRVGQVGVALFFLLTPALFAARIAVIDTDAKSLTIADLPTGKVERSVRLTDPPTSILQTRDGKRFVVLSRGTGKETWIGEFRPTSKGSATVVDATTLEVLGRVDLGWGVTSEAMFSENGSRLYVLSPGIDAKGDLLKPAELFALDLRTLKTIGPASFSRPAATFVRPSGGFALSRDARTAAIFFEGNTRAKRPTELRFVDLETMKETGTVSLDARTEPPVGVEGGDFLYLLDNPSTRAGKLYSVSVPSRQLAGTFDVGRSAKIAAADEAKGLLFVVSQSVTKGVRGANGQLHVLRGPEMVVDKKVNDEPRSIVFSPDRSTAYVLSSAAYVAVPLATLTPGAPVPAGPFTSEIAFSSDGSRGYLYRAQADLFCCAVSTMDLTKGSVIKDVTIGSKGERVLQALEAAAASVGSYSTGKSAARKSGKSSFYYSVYTPAIAKAGRGVLHVKRDGKEVYALDPQTSRLSILDAETGLKSQDIPLVGSPFEMVPVAGGAALVTFGKQGVTAVSTLTNKKTDEWVLSGDGAEVRAVEVSPDQSFAVVLTKQGMRGVTGLGVLMPLVEGVKNAADFLFLEK